MRLRRRRARARAGPRARSCSARWPAAAVAAVVVGEVGAYGGAARAPAAAASADNLLLAAEEAVVETAEVARAGYREVSTRENAMFNLLTSFAATFIAVRRITYTLRGRPRVGPFRNVRSAGATSTTSCPGS